MTETPTTPRINPDAAVQSFKSMDCPLCDSFKPRNTPVCTTCERAVPAAIRDELHTTGRRYEMALIRAAKALNTELRIAEREQ